MLPQVEVEAADPDEPEEEGEVALADNPAAHGPWVRRMLRTALRRHPATTLGFCFSCLGAAAAASAKGSKGGSGSSRGSSRGSSSAGSRDVDVAVLQGVRMWLKDHLLREASPSREGTPLVADGAAAAAAAAAGGGGGGGHSNALTHGKAGSGRGCLLQTVLASSQQLQMWIMQQARGRATGAACCCVRWRPPTSCTAGSPRRPTTTPHAHMCRTHATPHIPLAQQRLLRSAACWRRRCSCCLHTSKWPPHPRWTHVCTTPRLLLPQQRQQVGAAVSRGSPTSSSSRPPRQTGRWGGSQTAWSSTGWCAGQLLVWSARRL
jgi:hypothetical protein